AIIDGSHLDNHAHPNDLLNTHLAPGIRKLPSDINIEILKAIIANTDERHGDLEHLEALLTSNPLLAAIANGNFNISNPYHPNFGWTTRGATTILDGQAILSEGSPFLSNLSQTFIIPEGAKTLQFTLVDAQLGSTQFFPSDAFEVALLDAHSLTSLVDTIDELSFTDAFFNLQNTGKTYLGDDVQLAHVTGNSPRTFFIDMSHLTPGTEATLFFDLLGFGDNDSRVLIDDVMISTESVIPPTTINDPITLAQGQSTVIPIFPDNSNLEEILQTYTIQIQTPAQQGTVNIAENGTFIYTPNAGFAGTDTFTYILADSNGMQTNPTTVSVTVNNILPEIAGIENISEVTQGHQTVLRAIATDAGNDTLTYIWELSDGTQLIGQAVTHTFLHNGTYTATLTVIDAHGDRVTANFELNITNAEAVGEVQEQPTIKNGSGSSTENVVDNPIINNDTKNFIGKEDNSTSNNGSDLSVGKENNRAIHENQESSTGTTLSDSLRDPLPNASRLASSTSTRDFGQRTLVTNSPTPTQTDNSTERINQTWEVSSDILFSSVTDLNGVNQTTTLPLTLNPVASSIALTTGETQLSEITFFDFNIIKKMDDADILINSVNFGELPTVAGLTIPETLSLEAVVNNVQGSQFNYFTLASSQNGLISIWDRKGPDVTVFNSIFGDNNPQTANHLGKTIAPSPLNHKKQPSNFSPVTSQTSFKPEALANLIVPASVTGSETALTYNGVSSHASQVFNAQNVSHRFIDNGLEPVVPFLNSTATSNRQTLTIEFSPVVATSSTHDAAHNATGQSFTFNASFLDLGILDAQTVTWNFGDGQTATGIFNPTHSYEADGVYLVSLTVTNRDGAMTTFTLEVVVNQSATVSASITGDIQVYLGDLANFSAISLVPGTEHFLTYTWNFGDDSEVVSGQNVTHCFAQEGLYRVTLTVTDEQGASTHSTFEVTVHRVAHSTTSLSSRNDFQAPIP
ncbi:MAG: PKD domain-containing protein, partial [Cyanobacteria bacterium P01_G01_bin.49]